MVKTVSIAGIAVALAIVAFKGHEAHHSPESSVKQGQPELLAPQVFDFGDVYANGNVTQNLKLRNGGAGDLMVKKLVPGCGCIVPKEDHRVLKSGEEWNASLTLSAGPNLGVFTRRLAILSDDAKSPERVIELRANVVRDFAVTPASIILTSSAAGEVEVMGEVSITAERPDLIEEGAATVVGAEGAELTATVVSQDSKSYHLRVQGRVNSLNPAAAAQVKVKTQSKGEPVLVVGILLSKLAGLSIVPERLNLGLVADGQGAERNIVIHYFNVSKPVASRVTHCPVWLDIKRSQSDKEAGKDQDCYSVTYRRLGDASKSVFLKDHIEFEIQIDGRPPLRKSVEVAMITTELQP